jgi:hypothetical protein
MEDLWSSSDTIQEKNCQIAFNKATDVFSKLFDWLDRDGDQRITKEDMLYGISRIMIKDVDPFEVDKIIATYGQLDQVLKVAKVAKEHFLLAVANGMLDKSLKDLEFKETFIK